MWLLLHAFPLLTLQILFPLYLLLWHHAAEGNKDLLTDLERERLENKGQDFFNRTQDEDACRQCPPGFGVVILCTNDQDTICKECPAGTFNSKFTLDHPCSPCKTCGQWYYERTPCTPSQDVVCEPCFPPDGRETGGGYGNENFLQKCEGQKPPNGVIFTRPSLPVSPSTAMSTEGSRLPEMPEKEPSFPPWKAIIQTQKSSPEQQEVTSMGSKYLQEKIDCCSSILSVINP